MAIYECDNCEDTEEYSEEAEGYHCECGGHLFLKKWDYFEKDYEHTKCVICQNEKSEKCETCKWGKYKN